MKEIVVEVRGGLVVEIYGNDPDIRVILIDWDELESPEKCGTVGFTWDSCLPLASLPEDSRAQYELAKGSGR